VLWLAAALSAIAFSVAATVRAENARTSTAVDGLKAYYLAAGAVERAVLYLQWGPQYRNPDGTARYYDGGPRIELEFPSGQATVEVVPEASKMDLNSATAEELYALLTALGADPGRARDIALGIVAWRTPHSPGLLEQPDSATPPSFSAQPASFQEIEELLLVHGMTPELFYGTYARNAQGRLTARRGLRDCITVYGASGGFDVNTTAPAVLAAIGVPPDVVAAIVQARQVQPFTPGRWSAFAGGIPGLERLRVGGNQIYTIRATGRLRLPDGTLSDARRSVAAVVRPGQTQYGGAFQVLRWFDNAWVE
jgi:general secretion pathway protein K